MKRVLNIVFILFYCVGFSQTNPDSLNIQKLEDTKELFSNKDTIFIETEDTLSLRFIKKQL